jgi:hypothetical protein
MPTVMRMRKTSRRARMFAMKDLGLPAVSITLRTIGAFLFLPSPEGARAPSLERSLSVCAKGEKGGGLGRPRKDP